MAYSSPFLSHTSVGMAGGGGSGNENSSAILFFCFLQDSMKRVKRANACRQRKVSCPSATQDFAVTREKGRGKKGITSYS